MALSATSSAGMAVAPHAAAAQAGQAVLADGGNAVEAAVAIAAAIAVTYPHMNAIGGDGFWLIRRPGGEVLGIDACGRAAAAADLALYRGLEAIPWRGPLAANTVAGAISGWALALDLGGGQLPLSRLLEGAIRHSEDGIAITAGGAGIARAKSAELTVQPGAYGAIFEPHGQPLAQGELLRQPALARTMRRLVEEGLDSFYRGPLAVDIAEDLALLGSPVTLADLAAHRATQTQPLSADITGARLFNHRPPTQGIAALLILALADRVRGADCAADSFAHVHTLVEATKQAFRWRDVHCGDPDYMTSEAQALLDDTAALDAMAGAIDPRRAAPWPQPSQAGDTVWFGAADANGMIVSCIQSTYFEFGSGLVLPQTGICWQNRGSSFRLTEHGWNALRPLRKPFHTLNPALAVFDDGRIMAYGTMGGEGQPQTQAAVFSRVAWHGVGLADAIARPRWLLGRTWGEDSTSLKLEEGFQPSIYAELMDAGHVIETVPGVNSMMGHAGAIMRYPDGRIEGASDPRSDGIAAPC